ETWRVREVIGAVEILDATACGLEGGVAQRRAVRTHVGDETVLVEALRGPHRSRRREAQLAASLLLKRRSHERGRWRTPIGLSLDRRDTDCLGLELLCEFSCALLFEVKEISLFEAPFVVKVLAARDAPAIDPHQLSRKLLG